MINKIRPIHLWLIYFLYALLSGVIFFEFVIPSIPSLHAPSSTLTPDSTYFNDVAIKMAQDIKQYGWTSWRLYPATGAAGQSSFLAIFYVFFGVNPLYAVPFNAFFHALSGVLIYLIAIEVLGSKHRLNYFALLPATLFVVFPSSMSWVGQIHKEACLASGFLLGLWGVIGIIFGDSERLSILKYSIILILSIILIAAMKPYMLQILALVVLCLIFMQLIKVLPFNLKTFCLLIFYLFCLVNTFFLIGKYSGLGWVSGDSYIQADFDETYKWKKTPFIPEFVDSKLQAVSSARAAFIFYGLTANAKSMIDINVRLTSAVETIRYFPRAFQVSCLSPFPNNWFKAKRVVNFFSSVEMLICYVSFLGLLFYFLKGGVNCRILVCCIFAIVPLAIFGLTIPNIGTLYRVRYPFEMIVLMLGVCGWAHLFKRLKLIN